MNKCPECGAYIPEGGKMCIACGWKPEEEKKEFLADLGVESSGLDKLVNESYDLLGLMSFLTAGEDECRAWTFINGMSAPNCAGIIHTDFEKGFIKAEVVNYKDLLEHGSLAAAREKGLVGMEGKDYIVKDGDVLVSKDGTIKLLLELEEMRSLFTEI